MLCVTLRQCTFYGKDFVFIKNLVSIVKNNLPSTIVIRLSYTKKTSFSVDW